MARSAAQSLYPHLPSAERPERAQGGPRLSDAMYPDLAKEAKQREAQAEQKRRSKEMEPETYAAGLALLPALHLLGAKGRRR